MKHLFFISFLCLLSMNSNTSKASALILEEIQKAIIHDYKLEGKVKIIDDSPSVKAPIIPQKIQLLKGQQIVQEQLRQNREKLKQLQQIQENEEEKFPMNDFAQTKQKEIIEWQTKKSQEINNWQNEKRSIIKQWITDHKNFVKRIPEYKKNLISENIFKESFIQESQKTFVPNTEKQLAKEIPMPVFPDYFIIDKSLDVEIKDQGPRPTCAAFTGIRAIEILMSQQGKDDKLSEQYFFWSSIPRCQTSPCKKEGSWVLNGYRSSQEAKFPNIPLERNCPYSKVPMNDNVTQIPLNDGCLSGYAKIKKFNTVLTTAEIINAIKSGHPVIGGFKLTEDFYHNTGYVFQKKTNNIETKLDEHSGGHAILLVGIMKLPPELYQQEGHFCLISANSWGAGWGKGGHACLSERWIDKQRFNVPFVALEEIETI